MKKLYFILIFYLLITSCNQGTSKSEKDYIKNLEERNRALENELQNEKNKPPVVIEKPAEKIYVPQEVPVERNLPKDYFTIGSSEEEVLEVMGDPTSIMDLKYSNKKIYSYEYSSVTFTNGRVSDYSNLAKNLKVKARRK